MWNHNCPSNKYVHCKYRLRLFTAIVLEHEIVLYLNYTLSKNNIIVIRLKNPELLYSAFSRNLQLWKNSHREISPQTHIILPTCCHSGVKRKYFCDSAEFGLLALILLESWDPGARASLKLFYNYNISKRIWERFP